MRHRCNQRRCNFTHRRWAIRGSPAVFALANGRHQILEGLPLQVERLLLRR